MMDYSITRCAVGFLIREVVADGYPSQMWAFATIEDATAWLVSRYKSQMGG